MSFEQSKLKAQKNRWFYDYISFFGINLTLLSAKYENNVEVSGSLTNETKVWNWTLFYAASVHSLHTFSVTYKHSFRADLTTLKDLLQIIILLNVIY